MDGNNMYPIDRNDMIFLEVQNYGESTPPIVIYEKDNVWYLRVYPLLKI